MIVYQLVIKGSIIQEFDDKDLAYKLAALNPEMEVREQEIVFVVTTESVDRCDKTTETRFFSNEAFARDCMEEEIRNIKIRRNELFDELGLDIINKDYVINASKDRWALYHSVLFSTDQDVVFLKRIDLEPAPPHSILTSKRFGRLK